MQIGFTKMHGLGNDFIVIDNFGGRIKFSKEQVALLCDRRRGIGADGLILAETSPDSDCFMNYYNADGTFAEMCGNGIRCLAKFLHNDYQKNKTVFKIDTRAGKKEVKLEKDGTFSVNMGKPDFSSSDFPEKEFSLAGLELAFVSVGNPHAVAIVEKLEDVDLLSTGPKVENDENFPNRINLEIVENKGRNRSKVKVWERGCGETLACGTGATAAYAILRKKGIISNGKKEIGLELPGGELYMYEDGEGNIILRGPARSVFSGMVEI